MSELTPDDVAEIRSCVNRNAFETRIHVADLLALCDSLEAAWAERDQSEALFREQAIAHVREHERAERAERDRIDLVRVIDEHRAALARVRAHIDARPLYGTAYSLSERIRAAIEGDNQ